MAKKGGEKAEKGEGIIVKRNYKNSYQNRPARVQIDYSASIRVDETGSFNVWYSKYASTGSKFNKEKKAAEYRCVVERDAGRTRANSKQKFCYHFARGRCTRGQECTFLHRIPMPGDPIETTIDCFGRDKHRSDRDDMGGIGSFERRCQTLYIGNIAITDHMEDIVRAHFSEWGEIEHVNVLPEKGVAFVQYKSILNAEFAKAAMEDQKLESDDILNVRWAVEDPNPGVRESNKRKAEREVIESIKAQLPIVGEKGTILDYQDSYTTAPTKPSKYKEKSALNSSNTTTAGQESYYAGDVDQWQAYCEQYFEYYGVYPDAAMAGGDGESLTHAQSPGSKIHANVSSSLKNGNQLYAVGVADDALTDRPVKKALVANYSSSDED